MAQRGRFAGGAAREQALRALRDLPADQRAKRRLIHLAILERRDQGGDGAFDAVTNAHFASLCLGPVTFLPGGSGHYGRNRCLSSKLKPHISTSREPMPFLRACLL